MFHKISAWVFFGVVAAGAGYGVAIQQPKLFAIGVILMFAGWVIHEEDL